MFLLDDEESIILTYAAHFYDLSLVAIIPRKNLPDANSQGVHSPLIDDLRSSPYSPAFSVIPPLAVPWIPQRNANARRQI